MYSFGKNRNITNFVNVWILEDPVQDPKRSILAIFLWEPFFSDETANYVAIKTDKCRIRNITQQTTYIGHWIKLKSNYRIHKGTANKHGLTYTDCAVRSPILFYPKLVALDRFSLCGEKKWTVIGTYETILGKAKIALRKIVLVWLIYAWAMHGFEPWFLTSQKRECLFQLDQVVFWTIAKVFVTAVRVKWPLSKYI